MLILLEHKNISVSEKPSGNSALLVIYFSIGKINTIKKDYLGCTEKKPVAYDHPIIPPLPKDRKYPLSG